MKVLLVSSSSGSRGGGEFYLLGLAKGLIECGHDVQIQMSDHANMDELAVMCNAEGINCGRFRYTNTYHRRFRALGAAMDSVTVKAAVEMIQNSEAEIVHLNFQCVEDGLDLFGAGAACGVPCVATVHVTRSMHALGAAFGRLRDAIARRLIRKSRIPLIGISDVSTVDLADFVGTEWTSAGTESTQRAASAANRVYSVANGVAKAEVGNRNSLRNQWGLADDAFVLGCIARLEAQKNPEFIIPLLNALPGNVHVVWVGDGRLRSSIEEKLSAAGLTGRVILDGWRSDATSRMGGFDAFILPSLYEGMPLAILEAMSAGLPCVVSDVDGTRNAIEHGVSGFLCEVNHVSSWASTITGLMESPELRNQIGETARERHLTNFSLKAMAERTLNVYETVVKEFQSPVVSRQQNSTNNQL